MVPVSAVSGNDGVMHSMPERKALFFVGQCVHHRLFDYRGVIVDVDPEFQGSEQWYRTMARSRPPKDAPWYRVLVHETEQQTYVAERNLEPDRSGVPVVHSHIGAYFGAFRDGVYQPRRPTN